MSKHIKTDHGRPVETAKDANWKRRQRRKRLKARVAARREYMAGWVDRVPGEAS